MTDWRQWTHDLLDKLRIYKQLNQRLATDNGLLLARNNELRAKLEKQQRPQITSFGRVPSLPTLYDEPEPLEHPKTPLPTKQLISDKPKPLDDKPNHLEHLSKQPISDKPKPLDDKPKPLEHLPKQPICDKPKPLEHLPKQPICDKPKPLEHPPKQAISNKPKPLINDKPTPLRDPPKQAISSKPKPLISDKPTPLKDPPKQPIRDESHPALPQTEQPPPPKRPRPPLANYVLPSLKRKLRRGDRFACNNLHNDTIPTKKPRV